MKLKYFTILLTLSTLSVANAASKNLCDDLIESGGSSAEQIKKCQDKFGVSDYSKEQVAKSKAKEDASKNQSAADAQKKENIEFKKFTKDELFDAGFGKPFFAMRIDYRFNPPKEKRITSGDALCSYLGYEKSVKSVISAEVWENKVNPDKSVDKLDKQGLVIDTNFLGNPKDPELYVDEAGKFTIRKYVEITCVRRKDKSIENSDAVYKKLTEDLLVLPPDLKAPKKEENTSVDNSARSGKEGKKSTPNAYTQPDWMKDDAPATNVSK